MESVDGDACLSPTAASVVDLCQVSEGENVPPCSSAHSHLLLLPLHILILTRHHRHISTSTAHECMYLYLCLMRYLDFMGQLYRMFIEVSSFHTVLIRGFVTVRQPQWNL